MSNLRNSVQLIGHLGADPEMKTLESGTQMAKLRLATTETYKTAGGEWKEETQWHNITAWEALAERTGKQLHKGSFVLVQGKLINRSYTDAQGIKKYSTEIRATSFMMLDKKAPAEQQVAVPDPEQFEDLPF